MKNLGGILLIGAGLFVSLNLLHAQTASIGSINGVATPIQAAPPDSIVQATAQAQGLLLVAPADLPAVGGTFWLVTTNGIAAPSPCPPGNLSDFPVYAMADGIFLVDETGGQVATNADNGGTAESALAAEADAVVNLINQVQAAQAAPLNGATALAAGRGAGMAMMMADFSSMMTPTYDTNGLWLEMTNLANGWSYFNLHNATNQVYAILSTTSLAGGTWNIETELFPTLDQTNVLPFVVQNLDRQTLFLKAMDWTGVDSDGDGIPDWWAWQNWGSINVTDTNLDYSGNNSTFAQDYSNNIVPTVFAFTGIAVTNNYASSMSAPVQLAVTGSPYYVAVSVDDTNYAADAVWNTYSSSSLTVNLGLTEGWHDVWIGLRGHADDANSAVWQWRRLKLDLTPPQLTITSPTNPTVNAPVIQLTGFSSEALSSLAYDISNAAGTATNQPVMITGQFYDTNTIEFTTNYFQAYDVPLTNGLNVLTLHATDLAGNLTTLTTNINYVPTTNPPAVNLVWPQDGMQISGSSLTIQGQVDDPTATATMAVVDANGNTNTFNGLTGRDGNFWIENVPLNAGSNLLMVAVANAAGVSTTTLNLYQSSVNLTINAMAAGDTNVEGSIDTDGYTVSVNGNEATDNGDGTWTAQITPIGIGGGLVIVEAMPDGNNFSSSRRLAGRFQSMQDSNPDPDIYAAVTVPPPQGVFVSAYHSKDHQELFDTGEASPQAILDVNFDWADGAGGTEGGQTQLFNDGGLYEFSSLFFEWPASQWPQALPDGQEPPDTNSSGIGAPPLAQEHCDVQTPITYDYYWGTPQRERRTADTEMKLVTGGPLGSTQQNLWCLSATATDAETGRPIPPEQITIGAFGNQDTNSELWVMLPDGDPVVTPEDPDKKNYTFTVGATKFHPYIMANGINLDYNTPTNCVGQQVTFSVGWFPYTPDKIADVAAGWSLPGNFVNTNSDPNCDRYYSEDASQLIRIQSRDGTSSTSCWYVNALQGGTVKLVMTLTLKNGRQISLETSGQFNVHRPTTAQATPYQPDDTPTATIITNSNGKMFLSLGSYPVNDMSFSHTINPGDFSGQAGYVQLITSAEVVNAEPPPAPFNGTALDNALGEFPRGTPSIPAGTNTNVLFHDAPAAGLPPSDLPVSEDVSFSTYLMFKPAGGIWVPLRLIQWELHDHADPAWTAYSYHDVNPNERKTPKITGDDPSTVFPHWTTTW